MKEVKEDLTGNTFGRWKVIARAEDKVNKSGRVYDMWLCECTCEKHTRKIVYGDNLVSGKSTSCGCKAKETRHQNNLERNTYEEKDDYYIGHTQKGEPFYFDKEDYDLIKKYVWYVGKDGYVVTHNPNYYKNQKDESKLIRMHRLVLNLDDITLKVDHRDRKRNNNRKSNLRIATDLQNMQNQSKQRDSKYSKYKGVCYHKDKKFWVDYINVNGKRKHLGCFQTEEEAAQEYIKAAQKYFGEFACIEPGEDGVWNSVC